MRQRDALDGDAEPLRLVDEVVGDAAAGEGDDAIGELGEEFVVALEGRGVNRYARADRPPRVSMSRLEKHRAADGR